MWSVVMEAMAYCMWHRHIKVHVPLYFMQCGSSDEYQFSKSHICYRVCIQHQPELIGVGVLKVYIKLLGEINF